MLSFVIYYCTDDILASLYEQETQNFNIIACYTNDLQSKYPNLNIETMSGFDCYEKFFNAAIPKCAENIVFVNENVNYSPYFTKSILNLNNDFTIVGLKAFDSTLEYMADYYIDQKQLFPYIFRDMINKKIAFNLSAKVFDRDFLLNNNIYFNTSTYGITTNYLFISKCAEASQKIGNISDILVFRLESEDSADVPDSYKQDFAEGLDLLFEEAEKYSVYCTNNDVYNSDEFKSLRILLKKENVQNIKMFGGLRQAISTESGGMRFKSNDTKVFAIIARQYIRCVNKAVNAKTRPPVDELIQMIMKTLENDKLVWYLDVMYASEKNSYSRFLFNEIMDDVFRALIAIADTNDDFCAMNTYITKICTGVRLIYKDDLIQGYLHLFSGIYDKSNKYRLGINYVNRLMDAGKALVETEQISLLMRGGLNNMLAAGDIDKIFNIIFREFDKPGKTSHEMLIYALLLCALYDYVDNKQLALENYINTVYNPDNANRAGISQLKAFLKRNKLYDVLAEIEQSEKI